MHLYRVVRLAVLGLFIGTASLFFVGRACAQQQPRVVENVDVIGNRRLRKDDIIYYIQARAGETYNPSQVERDLQTINSLNFFDKAETRVTIEDGPRGGVNVTFYVKELPIVRDIQFEGLKSVSESDVLKTFREKRVGVSKEAIQDPVKLRNATRVLKDMLAAKGHSNATVKAVIEKVSATSNAITFQINEGPRVRVAEIRFEGSKVFKSSKLRDQMKHVQEAGLISRFREQDILDREKLDFDLHKVDNYMRSKGYLQARHGEPRVEGLGRRRTGFPILPIPFLSSTDDTLRITVPINEGKQFTLRRLEFTGNTFTRDNVLRREVPMNEGDIYNQNTFEFSVIRLNQLGYFNPIDKDKDVDFRTNDEEGTVDVTVKVAEKGRQQISFNGGVSGIGGSFFGLDYSTNNLFRRGEGLSINLAAGNRHRSAPLSFTEPYIRNRPITAGFSLFTYSQKFFGEGTFLSQNTAAQQGLFGNALDFFNTSEANLFTRNSTGGSIFASAPLSEFYRKRPFTQFSRIGVSYQLANSSVKDPAVNASGNAAQFIPVIYRQPSILTSRATATFAYDTRNASIDPTQGRSLSIALGVAGLGGDVRSYEPTIEFTQFYPVRHKRTDHPEVFGFRILLGTVGSFATSSKVRNANSLAFVDGVPIYERFFLGDEFTIRGYNVRSISPVTPLDNFITSRNVVIATNATGTANVVPGLPSNLTSIGTFTGATGSNVVGLPRVYTATVADTQVLGNFEYRIPIIGRTVQAALYADVGNAFNLRSKKAQTYSSEFLADNPFLATQGSIVCSRTNSVVPITLTTLAACQTFTNLAL